MNPPPRLSQSRMQDRYTTDTILVNSKITKPSSPTRIRTRNTSLEARDDHPFHHRAGIRRFVPAAAFLPEAPALCLKRKAWDSNPHSLSGTRISSAVRPTVSGYLPYQVDCRGIEPRSPGCKPSVLPLDEQPEEVRPGIEPGPRPYQGRVLPKHLQTNSTSDPGWNRTITLLDVGQASSPLDHGIISVTEEGVEPTESRASHARRFTCLRTRPD